MKHPVYFYMQQITGYKPLFWV